MKNWKSLFILAAITFIAVFFRLYKLEFFYSFEHDQDLYSWIVKDILIDRHFRLIGQMTSIQGFFIGPLYYYLLAPFYFFSGMNPLSATFLAPLISVLTLLSIFWVFTKIFNQKVGIIGAFIYSLSLSVVFIDRWIVPTQLTILWSIWFFYCLMKLVARDYKVLFLLGILTGLIWHIHIALLPLVILIPLVIVVSSKRPDSKSQILFFIMFF